MAVSEFFLAIWKEVQLTDAGRPVLLPDEVELIKHRKTILYDGTQLTEFVNGNLTVTTHRIIWLGSSKSLACHLSVVSEVAIYTPKFFSRHRVQLVIVGNVDRPKPHFVIKLEEGRREDFISWVTKACEMKTWEQTNQSEQKENKKEQGFTTSSAGIGGIIRKQKLQIERNEKVAEEALQDLDSLMKKAKEMVVLIERYRAQVDQSAKKSRRRWRTR